MDKKIMLSVAGSGKTTTIIDKMDLTRRFMILTYTNANFENLCKKIRLKYQGEIPANISVFKFDSFIYNILFKAMFADIYPEVKGIEFDSKKIPNNIPQKSPYYWKNRHLIYNSRISYFLLKYKKLIIDRINAITDCLIIDEVQDVGSRDFDLIMSFVEANIELLYVGDFYQHTYTTSADKNYRHSLFNDYKSYIEEVSKAGLTVLTNTLNKSFRCSKSVCDYITRELNILIDSHRSDETEIMEIKNKTKIEEIWKDNGIVKLHYQKSSQCIGNHRNWGDVKGEDNYKDVCIILNKKSYELFSKQKLKDLNMETKAKLYVAITRSRGNVFFVHYKDVEMFYNT